MADRNDFDTELESGRRRTGFVQSAQQVLGFVAASMLLGAGVAHAGPDLTTVDVDASAVTTDTQTLAVSGNLQVSIQNIGDTNVVASFDVLAFEDLNDNGEFDGADQVLGTASYAAGLPAGGLADVSVAVAGTVQFAGNLIYASADSGNVIVEDDESNNLRNTGQGSIFIPPVGAFDPVVKFQALRGLSIISTPMVVNLTDDNGDGQINEADTPDMVFATLPGTQFGGGPIVAISGDDGSQLFEAECPPRFGTNNRCIATLSELGVGDIDGDGLPEIIGANVNGNALVAVEHDGTFKWESDVDVLPGRSDSGGAISIANLDGLGLPEIIVGASVYDAAGTLLGDGRDLGGTTAFKLFTAISAVADVDLDGTPEIIAGPTAYRFEGGVLIKEWQRPDRLDGFIGIANFDDDDFAEIVVVGNGSVYMLNHDGTNAEVWNPAAGNAPVTLPGGGAGGAPTIADYDGDGENEIGIAGASRYVVFEAGGTVKWTSVTQDFSSQTTGSTPFDFDGDGSVEVVYRDERFLRIYRGTDGFILFQMPMRSGTSSELPVVADIDNDGRAEIAVSSDRLFGGTLDDTGIYVIEDANDTWVNTRSIWNQHSYHITNVNLDGTIPAVEQNNWQVAGLNNFRQNLPLPDEGTALDAPDLVPSFIRFDQQNCPEFVTLTARVGNGGSLLAPTGLNVSFYDGPPGAGGTLIGTTQTSFNLESGQFEDVSVQWNAPPVGNADVYVVADDDGAGNGAINEGNEDNNTASASEVLCSPVCIDNLSARPKPGKIQLTWTHVQGATYDVLRSGAVGGPFTQIASTDSSYSTYLDQPVDNGVPYYYQIRRMPGVLGENSCLSDVLGAVAPEGRRDRLTTVPDIREQPQAAAEAALAAANLGVGAVTLVASDTVPAGDVVDQDPPPNSVVPQGFAVAFSVSTGVGGPTNTLPIADAGGDETITEGDTLNRAGSFVDPDTDTWTATVDYGDGGGPQGLFLTPAKTFDLGHVYVDDGVFTVTVTVNDGTGPGSASFTVQVLNAAPLVEAGSDRTITAGDSTSLDPASFTDAGIADSHTATIDWGDGTVEPGVVTQGAGSGTVAGSHAYAAANDYVVTVTVTDNAGASGSDTFTVSVNPAQVTVPDVVGLSQAAASDAIVAADLTVGTVTTANSETVPAGDVISQDPAGGSTVAEGSPVDLVVSLGPPDRVVPDVVGQSQAAAEAAILAANLTVGAVTTSNSDTVPSGNVISQDPAGGTSVADGSPVDLVVSLGPVQVTVPDVVGLSQVAAEAAILAENLTVGTVTTANSNTVPAGDVISQDPAGGSTVNEGLPVDLVVSLGPIQVTVPDVVGLAQAAAEAAIIAADLTVGAVTTANSNTVPAGNVISQNPTAASVVDEGSLVDLVVSLGPVQVAVPDVVGLSQAVAEAAIVAANLTVGAVTAANSDTVPEGDVISQNPAAGTSANENSAVDIEVSLGAVVVPVTVPDVVGLSQAAAEAAIVAADLTVGNVTTANSDTVPAGEVISQNPPAGASVAEDSAVDIAVSLGPVIVAVPDVVGNTQAAAEAAIIAAGLTVGTVDTVNSDTVPAGQVISQNPAGGALVAEGSAVDILVSLGELAADDVDPLLDASLNLDPPLYSQGAAVLLDIFASDDSGTVSVTGTLDGAPLPITLPVTSIDTSSMPIPSNHVIVVTATDPGGNNVSQTLTFTIRDPADTTFPTVSFSAPSADSELTVPTDVVGTANDATLANYQLQLSPVGDNQFTTFFTGFTPVVADVLGLLDTTLIANGVYDLRLTALDSNGNSASVQQPVLIAGQNKPGAFRIEFLELDVPVEGIPIRVKRIYDSRKRQASGDFGFGWDVEVIKAGEYANNREPGDGWFFSSGGGFFPLPCQGGATPTKSHITEIRFSDTDFYRFQLNVVNAGAITGGCAGVASFSQIGGVPGASLVQLDGNGVFWQNASDVLTFDLGDPRFGQVYEPEAVRLTTLDGRQFDLSLVSGLNRIGDQNGNSIFISNSGVTHSSGKSISFTRDGSGRITTITDPLGNSLNYTYDAEGNLFTAADRVGNTTSFGYDFSHYLLDIMDPLGNMPIRYEYDDAGRVVAQIGPDGSRVEIDTDLLTNTTQVTDRIGTVITFGYDDDGNITDSSGGGASYQFTYDPRGNKLTQTDALGNTASFTYDANDNVLSETDALGNTTAYTYNAGGRPNTVTDAAGTVMSFVHDGSGNPTQVTDGNGTVVQAFTYDASGNPTQVTTLGGVNNFTYDGSGYVASQTGPGGLNFSYTYDDNGNVLSQSSTRTTGAGPVTDTRTYTYDANGRVLTMTDPLGNVSSRAWNSNGRLESETDALGNVTSFDYDLRGNVFRKNYADGTFEAFGYDGKNRKTAETDRAGRTKFFEYDLRGNLTQVIFPDGGTLTNTYDAVNNLTSTTDQLGNTTTYDYDANNRQTQKTDALGNIMTFAYNSLGVIASSTDPLGRVSNFAYDNSTFGAPRVNATTFPDGSSQARTYSDSGRVASTTDESGFTTSYTYDGVGNLLTVTDPLGNLTTHTYDEAGNRIVTTNANGNATSMEYDGNGRLLSRTNPLGDTESFTYDAVGNVVSHADYNGDTTTYVYDVMYRLVTKNMPASSVDYTYTSTDMVETITDSRGVAAYVYDSLDRVVQITQPDGTALDYTYDAAGNRTTVTSPAGVTSYAYDAVNRLSQVTDPQGGLTSYAYDAAGQLANALYPNGTATQYTYDPRARVTTVQHLAGVTTLGQFDYVFDPVGNRTRMTESSGRVVDYTYDARRMLVQESDNIGGSAVATSYTYDALGNRLSINVGGTPTAYTYDAGDRLLTAGAESFAYDSNGNLLTRTVGTDVTGYSYDAENRLLSQVTPAGVTTNYLYDDFGNRVQSETAGVVTNYVVDPEDNSGVPQVVAEQNAAGALQRGFVYGNSLIRQRLGATDSYYHPDGLGSTRLLTDSAGAVSDTYSYSAYGNLAGSTGGTSNNYRFAGEQLDPNSGLYYLRARYMDPTTGRFISQDPLQGKVNDPLSMHRYLYVNNNPVNMLDPTGEFGSLAGMSVSISIVSTLSSIAIAGYGIYTDITDIQDKVEELLIKIPKLKLNENLTAAELKVRIIEIKVGLGGASITFDAHLGGGAVSKAYDISKELVGGTSGELLAFLYAYSAGQWMAQLPQVDNKPGHYLSCGFNDYVFQTFQLQLINGNISGTVFKPALQIIGMWLNYFNLVALIGNTASDFSVPPQPPGGTCPIPIP